MLKENLKTVEEHVQEACKRAGRSREEVTLIAVSKTKTFGNAAGNLRGGRPRFRRK